MLLSLLYNNFINIPCCPIANGEQHAAISISNPKEKSFPRLRSVSQQSTILVIMEPHVSLWPHAQVLY